VTPARRSRLATAVLGLGLVAGVTACTSKPSAKAVATDIVESMDDLAPAERQCLLDKLDGYSSDELEALGNANLDVDFDQPDAVEHGTEDFQKFVADLETCTDSG
jgi:hypothetical protein